MATDLSRWRFEMLIWGWALTSNEPDPRRALRDPAIILESRQGESSMHTWDSKPKGQRFHGPHEVPIPDWFGLHYLPPEWIYQALEEEQLVEVAETIVEDSLL